MMQRTTPQPLTPTGYALLRQIAGGAGLLVVLIGSLTLLGWLLQVDRLRMPVLDMAAMKPNEALALISAGLALLCWRQPRAGRLAPRRRWLAQGLGGFTALIGLLTLSEYLFGWELGIDELFFSEQVLTPFSLYPGRMAFNTAICLLLIGSALILVERQVRAGRPSEWLTLVTGFIVLLAVIGHIYQVQEFIGPFDFSGMALHSCLAFVALCAGLLVIRPEAGMMAHFWSNAPQGIVARQMAFGGASALLVLGWLTKVGQAGGWYSHDFESALLLSLGVAIFAFLIDGSMRALAKVEAQRQAGLTALQEQHALIQGVINGALDGIYVRDLEGRYRLVNQVGAALLDHTPDEMIGKRYQELFSSELSITIAAEDQLVLATGKAHVQELQSAQAQGQRVLHSMKSPYRSYQGEIVGVLNIVRDITERKAAEDQLRASQQALQQLNETLEQRVTERTRELERSNQELDQFAYVASHDLKAPLRAILNLANWLNEDATEELNERSKEHLQKLYRRAQRMERLLDDLLTYSRIGRRDGASEQINVEHLVLDVIYLLAPPAEFQIHIGPMPTLTAPRIPLELVFRNLIGNALKHHDDRQPGRIEITAIQHAAGVEFQVHDNGPGIDAQYHQRIFGMFQTLLPRDDVEGSGMGLALVKKCVEYYGGQITLNSAVGAGATFCFTWPQPVPTESSPLPTPDATA